MNSSAFHEGYVAAFEKMGYHNHVSREDLAKVAAFNPKNFFHSLTGKGRTVDFAKEVTEELPWSWWARPESAKATGAAGLGSVGGKGGPGVIDDAAKAVDDVAEEAVEGAGKDPWKMPTWAKWGLGTAGAGAIGLTGYGVMRDKGKPARAPGQYYNPSQGQY
jgi:hypothetical protein